MFELTAGASHFLVCRRVFLVAAVAAGLGSSAMAQSTPLFPQPVAIPLPNTAPATTSSSASPAPTLKDMNGDGAVDLVYITATQQIIANGVPILFTPTIHVMLHDGTPTASVTLPAASPCIGSPMIDDFNGDGKQDVAIGCEGKLYVLLGNGDGSLRNAIEVEVAANANIYDYFDVNKDGLPDVITGATVNGNGILNIQLNHGQTLGAATTYPIAGRVDRIRAGDVNGDGNLDLIVTGSHLTVLYGKGDGTFQAPVSLAETGLSLCVAVGDLNGDGIDDIASCSTIHTDSVDVLFGSSSGGVPAIARSYPLPVGSGPSLSGNGLGGQTLRADRLKSGGARALFYGSNNLSIYVNDGAGNFSVPLTFAGYATNLALADWNGDGNEDVLAIGDTGPEILFVAEGDGAGNFQGLPPATFLQLRTDYTSGGFGYAPEFATQTAAGDFNRDGLLDFVTLGANGPVVFLSNGDGTTTAVTSPGPTAGSYLLEGDLNGDGKADVLVLTSAVFGIGDVTITSCLGTGTGAFTCGSSQDLGLSNASTGGWALADFTGDGIPDLILGTYIGDVEQYYFLRGLGNGNFAAPVLETMPSDLSFQLFLQGFFAVDINHDGKADLIPVDPSIALLSNGDGTFTEGGEFAVNAETIVGVADITGDGNPDVIALTSSLTPTPELVIYPGTASGTFPDSPIVVMLPTELQKTGGSIAVGDLNGDGLTDVALLTPTSIGMGVSSLVFLQGELEVLPILNHANTSFALDAAGPYVVPSPSWQPGPFYAGKMNRSGTGAVDLAYSMSVSTSIAVLLNATNPAPPVMTSTVTVASVSADPVPRGQVVTLGASVSSADGTTASGTVSVLVNGQVAATAVLSQGAASVSVPTSGVAEGAYALSVRYNGDATHRPSTSGVETVSVTGATAPTITALNISYTGGLTQDSPVQVEAGVYAAAGGGAPSGSVSFYANSKLIGTTMVANHYAKLSFNTGSVLGGSYAVHAVYSGDATYSGSNSDSLSYVVHNVTATTVALSPTTGAPGASITVTAHVSRPLTSGVPTGQVQFGYSPSQFPNGSLGEAPLDSKGNATITAKVPTDAAPGTYTVTAQFDASPMTYDELSIGTATFVVTKP